MTYLNMWRLMKEKSRRNAYFLCLGRKRHIDQLCTAAVYSDNSTDVYCLSSLMWCVDVNFNLHVCSFNVNFQTSI